MRRSPVIGLLSPCELERMRTALVRTQQGTTAEDLADAIERAWRSHSGEPPVVAAVALARLRSGR